MQGTQLDLFGKTVWFVDCDRGWMPFRTDSVKGIRTIGPGGKLSDGSECKDPCYFAEMSHFMITEDGIAYTKLCTLDVLKQKPFIIPKGLLLGQRRYGKE